jgi:alanyl aminopeptidase
LPVPFCDKRRAAETERLFAPRVAALAGGARDLAGAVEEMRLCAARREAQEGSAKAFFRKMR